MSKSIGNVLDLPWLLERFRPIEIRYYLATPHYRSTVEFSEALLSDAAAAYRRIEGFLQRASERLGAEATTGGTLCADFVEAMDDDLNTAKAVAAIHEVVRGGNTALADGHDDAARGAAASVRAMLGILGLDPATAEAASGAAAQSAELRNAVDVLVRVVLEQRDAARARKDWATADALRDQLKRSGVQIEDTPHGPRWTLDAG
jgi:cysteinyl-tRNA synthetase